MNNKHGVVLPIGRTHDYGKSTQAQRRAHIVNRELRGCFRKKIPTFKSGYFKINNKVGHFAYGSSRHSLTHTTCGRVGIADEDYLKFGVL